jgi:hypothetical protein
MDTTARRDFGPADDNGRRSFCLAYNGSNPFIEVFLHRGTGLYELVLSMACTSDGLDNYLQKLISLDTKTAISAIEIEEVFDEDDLD